MMLVSIDSCDSCLTQSGGAQFMKPWPRLMASGGTLAGLSVSFLLARFVQLT